MKEAVLVVLPSRITVLTIDDDALRKEGWSVWPVLLAAPSLPSLGTRIKSSMLSSFSVILRIPLFFRR